MRILVIEDDTRIASLVEAAFAMRLQTWDDTDGTDATVLIDGAYNHLESRRASIPSPIRWDAAFLVEALRAMDYPQAKIDWMVNALMALRAIQGPAAEDAAAWLMGQVLPTGQVVLSDDNEYFEIDGEVLTALLR